MGTRNATIVIQNGQTKVGQYAQWDGYPSGQGRTALNFLKNMDRNKFEDQLQKCRFVNGNKREEKKMQDFLKSIGCSDGWMTMEQGEKYHKQYPYLSRDHGAEILQKIHDSTDEIILLENSEDFVKDSLFCEWAYVIDLDLNTFEVYEGFNKSPLDENERFAKYNKDCKGEYWPVKLVKSYDLANLPTEVDFVNEIETLTNVED